MWAEKSLLDYLSHMALYHTKATSLVICRAARSWKDFTDARVNQYLWAVRDRFCQVPRQEVYTMKLDYPDQFVAIMACSIKLAR